MKKIGIIGGAGPLASALFYETIVQECYLQAHQVPEILLINYPFSRALTLEEGVVNESKLKDELQYCVDILSQYRVDVGILTCNTLHLYLPLLEGKKTPFSFYALPFLVMEEAKERGHRRLLILGTQNTCNSQLYQHPEMEMVYPYPQHQRLADEVIDRVLKGEITPKDSFLMSEVISQIASENSFDGVVLGCTDLPVLHHRFPIASKKPLYDSIKIPAKILKRYI